MINGDNFNGLTLDNSNIGFNLPIIILFPIINWIAESETKSNQYIYMFILLFFLLLLCFLLNSLIIPFICYEYLIILLFFILFIFIPSFHRIRTAFFSFLFSTISFSDYLGRIHSSSFFISTNSIFFTMHSLGIIGFPRRIYDYSMIFFKFRRYNG